MNDPVMDAAVAAALRKMRVPETRWATVLTWEPLRDQTTVRVDGDTNPTAVVNATNLGLSPNQRVLVLFTPPSGAHVIGARAGEPLQYVPTLANMDVDDGTVTGEYAVANGIVDWSVTVVLGSAGAVSGTIGVGLPLIGSSLVTTEWLTIGRATIGSDRFTGSAPYVPGTSTEEISGFGSDGLGLWTTTVPAAWGPGDLFRVTGRYPLRLQLEDQTPA